MFACFSEFNEFPERIFLPGACEGHSPTIGGRRISVLRSQKALPFIFTSDLISLIKGKGWYINEVR